MSGPLPFHLLPEAASVDGEGQALVGGLRLTDIAEEFGTPAVRLRRSGDACIARREAVEAFGTDVAYASKAFLCLAMARLTLEAGMRIDVATGGEMAVAIRAGYPARRIVLHGNNKSADELRQAMWVGVGTIVVDSFDEIDRIESLVAVGGRPPRVMVRVTPGVEAHTHEFVRTGQEDSKFGFGWHSGAAMAAVERVRSSTAMEYVGIHMHIGSQVFVVDSFAEALEVVAPLIADTRPAELCIGGGLGVPYIEGEEAPTISQWGSVVRNAASRVGVDVAVTAEPGRSIVARAGITLYTVGTIKEIPGVRTYVSVDGGMSDNPRPVLYGSGYEAFLPRRVTAPRPTAVRVVGKHCESGDVLVAEAAVPDDVSVGDVLATPVTGAYGHSMGSNYNKVLRPPVVFVKDGDARQVVRRETVDDLLSRDV